MEWRSKMQKNKLKVIHYLNQFFGQIGGEEKTDVGFSIEKKPVGPGLAMQKELGELAARWLAEHPGYEKSIEDTDPVFEEIGDLLHLVLAFCNTQGINSEDCVKATIEKRRKNRENN